MTIPVLSWRAAVLKTQLPSTTKFVLLALACHMNDFGEDCFPSVELLCAETGLSNRAVISHLQKAIEAGWITVFKHGYGGRRWARNEYHIGWPELEEGSERRSLPQDNEAVNVATRGSERSDNEAVNVVHTNSSINSSKNSPAPSNSARSQEQILWDHTRELFTGISEAQMDEWEKAYPQLDVDAELTRIEVWYKANPKKHKRDVRRFITNWLARTFNESRKPRVFIKQPPTARPP